MIDDFNERARTEHGLSKTPEGKWLCWRCAKTELADDQIFWCAPCDEIKKAEWARKEAEEQQARWVASVKWRCHHAFERVPDWEHTATREGFEAKVSDPNLRKIAEKWTPKHGSVLALGPSGCGKTSTIIRALRRLEADLVSARLADPDDQEAERRLSELGSTVWCTASEVCRELAQHRLGSSEPELIRNAASAGILMIDELGPEPSRYAGEIFDLIDRRYAKKRPTVCTTGLTTAVFIQRYGDALYRRISERGIGRPVDLHQGGSDG